MGLLFPVFAMATLGLGALGVALVATQADYPDPEEKRSAGSAGGAIIFSFPDTAQADLTVLHGTKYNVLPGSSDGERQAVSFFSEATNFTGEGSMTGIGRDDHGISHGHLYVPLGEEVVKGNWFSVDADTGDTSTTEAFEALKSAVFSLHEDGDAIVEMLTMLADKDDVGTP